MTETCTCRYQENGLDLWLCPAGQDLKLDANARWGNASVEYVHHVVAVVQRLERERREAELVAEVPTLDDLSMEWHAMHDEVNQPLYQYVYNRLKPLCRDIEAEAERLRHAVDVALEWPDMELRHLVQTALGESNTLRPTICGIVCHCGPKGEPIACGYPWDHDGPHSWSTLPSVTMAPVAVAVPSDEEIMRAYATRIQRKPPLVLNATDIWLESAHWLLDWQRDRGGTSAPGPAKAWGEEFEAMALSTLAEPFPPTGLEPRGCPTPGACSCPVAEPLAFPSDGELVAAYRKWHDWDSRKYTNQAWDAFAECARFIREHLTPKPPEPVVDEFTEWWEKQHQPHTYKSLARKSWDASREQKPS